MYIKTNSIATEVNLRQLGTSLHARKLKHAHSFQQEGNQGKMTGLQHFQIEDVKCQ